MEKKFQNNPNCNAVTTSKSGAKETIHIIIDGIHSEDVEIVVHKRKRIKISCIAVSYDSRVARVHRNAMTQFHEEKGYILERNVKSKEYVARHKERSSEERSMRNHTLSTLSKGRRK